MAKAKVDPQAPPTQKIQAAIDEAIAQAKEAPHGHHTFNAEPEGQLSFEEQQALTRDPAELDRLREMWVKDPVTRKVPIEDPNAGFPSARTDRDIQATTQAEAIQEAAEHEAMIGAAQAANGGNIPDPAPGEEQMPWQKKTEVVTGAALFVPPAE